MCQGSEAQWSKSGEAGGGGQVLGGGECPERAGLAFLLVPPPPQVNRTFQELALLKDIQEVWGTLGPQLFNFLNDSTNMAMLQVGPWPPWAHRPCPRCGQSAGQGLLSKCVEAGCRVQGADRPQE